MPQHATPGSLLGKIAAYTELLAKDPYSTIFVPLSEAYRQMDMLDEAVAVAQQGIMDNPAFAAGYVALGSAFAAQGLQDQAIGEFEKALILDNRHLPALKELAKIKMTRQDSAGARELLEQAKAIKGNDPEVLKLVAAVAPSQPAAAAPVASPAPEPPVPAPAPSFEIDEVQETVSAPSLAGKGVEPIATATLAEIYIRQGLPQKALKVYRDLLKLEPHNDQLRQKLILLKQQIDGQEVPALGDETLLASESVEETAPAEEVLSTEEPLLAGEFFAESSPDEVSAVSPALEAEPAFSVLTEDTGAVEPGPATTRGERAVPEVLTSWLDAIRRRRAAHV
jgi:tetratricopeptide (TPR) repeat protein